jgi:hypothetical protein
MYSAGRATSAKSPLAHMHWGCVRRRGISRWWCAPATRRGSDPVVGQRHNVQLLDAVAHTVNALGHTGLFTIRGDGEIGAVVALGARAAASEKAWNSLGTGLAREVARVDSGQRSVLALGEPSELVTDAVHGLGNAAHIAEVALAMRGQPRLFYRASDVRLRGLIFLLQNDPRVQAFAETELKGLLSVESAGASTDLAILRESPAGGKQGRAGSTPAHQQTGAIQTTVRDRAEPRGRSCRCRIDGVAARGDVSAGGPPRRRRRRAGRLALRPSSVASHPWPAPRT